MSVEQPNGTHAPDGSNVASGPFAQWSPADATHQRQAQRPFAHAFRQPQAPEQVGPYAPQSTIFNAGPPTLGQYDVHSKPLSIVDRQNSSIESPPQSLGGAPPQYYDAQHLVAHAYPTVASGVQIQQSQTAWIGMDPAVHTNGQHSALANGQFAPYGDQSAWSKEQARHQYVADTNAQAGPYSAAVANVTVGSFTPRSTASHSSGFEANGWQRGNATQSPSALPQPEYSNGFHSTRSPISTDMHQAALPPITQGTSSTEKGKGRADSETTEVNMQDGTKSRSSPALTTRDTNTPMPDEPQTPLSATEPAPQPRKPAAEYTDEELMTEAKELVIDDLLKYFRKDIVSRAVMPRIFYHTSLQEGGSAAHAAQKREDEQERKRQAEAEAAGADYDPNVLDINIDGLADSDDDLTEKARRVRRERERRGKKAKANPKRPRTSDARFSLDDDLLPILTGSRQPSGAAAASNSKPKKSKQLDAETVARREARKRKEIEDLGGFEDLGPRRRTHINFGSPEPGGDEYVSRSTERGSQMPFQAQRSVIRPAPAARPSKPTPVPKLQPETQPELVVDTFYAQDAGPGMTFGKAISAKLEFGPLVDDSSFFPTFDLSGIDFSSFRMFRPPDVAEVEFRERWREDKKIKLWERASALAVPNEPVKPVELGPVYVYEQAEMARDWDLKAERARVRRQARFDAACSIPTELPDPFKQGVADDVEDLYFVQCAIERLRQGKSMHLIAPEDDPETVISRHSTGSARTEGFYKMTVQEKMANRPPPERPVIAAESDWVKPPDKSGVAVSRAARVNNRGAVRGMEMSKKVTTAIDSDVINFNQLKTRKKQLTFSRSGIEGYGLFAKEHIPQGDMVIEYVGELIRQQVADRREKAYERQGIGSSYLFRVDEDLVVDATKKGNLGRLINHCCVPNCTARIITINNSKKIVIYAKRNIEPGEEVTYDYHFAHEDVKVICVMLVRSPNVS
ncbi:histone methyltransferase set1 [Microbotryomycetes sp. JL201]|nr:histone methyltransferase set1 [Microbotryomycetes sp. JL201]